MSGNGELQKMIIAPPRQELRALLKREMPMNELSEEDHGVLEPVCRRTCRGRGLKRKLKHVAGLVLGSLALVLVVRGTTYAVVRQGSGKEFAALSEDLDCHTAVKGERCYGDVVWAMRNRKKHPEWYIGINNCSDFHDFQSFMHTQILNSGARRCPKPCVSDKGTPPKARGKECKANKHKEKKNSNCHTAVPGDDCYAHMIYTKNEALKYPRWYPGIVKESSLEDVQYYLHTERECPMPCIEEKLKKEDNITGCHMARPGDTCFADILLAKDKFIVKHPEWYKGLTQHSSNDLFQAFLHAQKHSDEEAESKACPPPCNKKAMDAIERTNTCKTAEAGDACYESALWGATTGIRMHPEWYPELTPGSSLEEFQIHLHHDNNTKCHDLPCPCQRPVKGDDCYKSILWVYSHGLEAHPDRFKGLNEKSSLEEVQQHLHELRTSSCGRPCKTFDEDHRSPWKQTWTWM